MLGADTTTISATAGGAQAFEIDAGASHASELYLLLGSLSGDEPGTPTPGGLVLPLNLDAYFQFTLDNPNTAVHQDTLGSLDAAGRARLRSRGRRRRRESHPGRRNAGGRGEFVLREARSPKPCVN